MSLRFLIAVAALAVAIPAHGAKPNVVLILADDLGGADLGCYGSTFHKTPKLDALAKQGVRFTEAYAACPVCSPTRAALLTGKFPARLGITDWLPGRPDRPDQKLKRPPLPLQLPLDEITLAERLKAAGYATCAVGKWHLGSEPAYYPMKRGFEEFYGTLANTPFFKPREFVDSRLSAEVRPMGGGDFYTTDAYAERAVDWLGRQAKDRPWFLYVPFNAQHAPLEAPQKYLDRFAGVADPKRRTFAAMMSAMDDAVGRILEQVRAMGLEENTLIFFLADNGGPTASTTSRNGPLRGFKSTTWEGGVRVPFCAQWKGRIPAGKTYDHPIIQLDIQPTCLAAAGVAVDPAWKLDGVDLLPYLTGQKEGRPHETLYWRFGEQMAIRHGQYKLVIGNGGSGRPELYDLAADIAESKDLSAELPERKAELQKMWDAWNAEQAPPSAAKEPGKKTGKVKPGKKGS
jgi:arylsulfatase A-like enzyme